MGQGHRGNCHRPDISAHPGRRAHRNPAPQPRIRRGRYHEGTVSSLRIGPRPFLLLCRLTLGAVILNIATGAAVRLSDSGLGCPDWPTCSKSHLTPPLSLHPVIEFGNRVVVTVLVVACGVTMVASFLRRPNRRDLRWLSIGLVLGVLGEAVLGAFVVYTKLNAYVVMSHFMLGMALLAVALVLTLRAGHARGRGTVVVSTPALWLTRVLVGLLVVVLIAGTATTGAGPHAGGKGAKRLPIALEDMTRIHAEIVIATTLVLLLLLWVLWTVRCPQPCPGQRPDPPRRRGGPGHHRVHPVLHPPPRGAGLVPCARSLTGVVDRPLVPPRVE